MLTLIVHEVDERKDRVWGLSRGEGRRKGRIKHGALVVKDDKGGEMVSRGNRQ